VKEMPNFVGMAARPRLRQRLPVFHSAAAARRASKSELPSTWRSGGATSSVSVICCYGSYLELRDCS